MSKGNPYFGATFAERKAARLAADGDSQAETKQVDDESPEVEDKAIAKRATSRKSARKS